MQRKIDGFPRNPSGEVKPNDQREFDDLKSQLGDLDKKIHGLDDLNHRLSMSDPHSPDFDPTRQRPYVLRIDDAGAGRAIVAMGNPDTAQHVATYVPGTGSELSEIGGDMDRADRMVDAARQAGARSMSVITWLGYDAPPTLLDAASESYADHGKHALDSFQDGLRESHQRAPSRNTVVGHSYGTALVGHAARDEHLAVDNVVLMPAPGSVSITQASCISRRTTFTPRPPRTTSSTSPTSRLYRTGGAIRWTPWDAAPPTRSSIARRSPPIPDRGERPASAEKPTARIGIWCQTGRSVFAAKHGPYHRQQTNILRSMPAAIRRQTFTLLIALIALVVSSCGEDAAMKNTITIQEANQRVEDYMSRARVAFPPSAQFALQSQFKLSLR